MRATGPPPLFRSVAGFIPLRLPLRCLCFGFSQITRTTPFRRMTLHLTQNFRTDGLTFIFVPSSFEAIGDPAPGVRSYGVS